MSMRLSTLTISVVVVITAPVAGQPARRAPEPSVRTYFDPQEGISLPQAIAHALEREPALRAVRTDIDVARGMRVQAALRPNPTLSLERREEPGGTDHQTSVAFEWPLDLFRKPGRVAIADRNLEVAESAVKDQERILAADVRAAYGQLLTAIREASVFDELVVATRRQYDVVRARAEEGATPPLERDLLDVEARRLDAQRFSLVTRADAAMVELKRLLGLGPAASLSISDTLEGIVLRERSTPIARPQPTALDERPDVREAEIRERLAAARIDSARREGRFDVSLVGGYMRMDAGFPQTGFGAGGNLERVRGVFNYATVGAMVTVPLRNRNQGEIAAAEAQRAGAEARREAIQLAARAELAAAVARDENAQTAVAIYTTDVRQLARQNLTVVGQTYELGRTTVFDVLAEQRRFLDLERTYTEALWEAYDARTALQRATGDVR